MDAGKIVLFFESCNQLIDILSRDLEKGNSVLLKLGCTLMDIIYPSDSSSLLGSVLQQVLQLIFTVINSTSQLDNNCDDVLDKLNENALTFKSKWVALGNVAIKSNSKQDIGYLLCTLANTLESCNSLGCNDFLARTQSVHMMLNCAAGLKTKFESNLLLSSLVGICL